MGLEFQWESRLLVGTARVSERKVQPTLSLGLFSAPPGYPRGSDASVRVYRGSIEAEHQVTKQKKGTANHMVHRTLQCSGGVTKFLASQEPRVELGLGIRTLTPNEPLANVSRGFAKGMVKCLGRSRHHHERSHAEPHRKARRRTGRPCWVQLEPISRPVRGIRQIDHPHVEKDREYHRQPQAVPTHCRNQVASRIHFATPAFRPFPRAPDSHPVKTCCESRRAVIQQYTLQGH